MGSFRAIDISHQQREGDLTSHCRQYRKHQIYHDVTTSPGHLKPVLVVSFVSHSVKSFLSGAKHKWFNITDTDRLFSVTVNIPSSLSLSLSSLFSRKFSNMLMLLPGGNKS